ncbi:hypothetical protein BHYA_0189g00040 [Botrytis hyacinthi]|uniref:Methyltransferase type 11 domain-containing protein n=1 Tax=Botrytis hyacinthi TaxID=278943 RepID=A0A4Z1GL89_9HELO|nr:hypothetical protein BHYA_0189g00040 [Botrytis hyacinthi]
MSETQTMPVKDPFHTITHLLPPFTADAIIHDNGRGTDEVTKAIMESNPPEGIIIKATDRNQYMIDSCREFVIAGNWPVEAVVLPAQSLTFLDNQFTRLFSNFLISNLHDDHDPAAKQVYRTLKPGSTAIVSTWAAIARGEPIKRAHLKTRGPDVPFPMAMPIHWYGKDALKNFFYCRGIQGGGYQDHDL